MVNDVEPSAGDSVVPRSQTAAAVRVYSASVWSQVRETFETILAGAPSFTISSVKDMHTPELDHILDTYYQGTNLPGRERIKLFNLIWDALYSEFAGRHGLYERNYAGNGEQQRLDALKFADIRGDVERCKNLVDQAMGDYDSNGWVNQVWKTS